MQHLIKSNLTKIWPPKNVKLSILKCYANAVEVIRLKVSHQNVYVHFNFKTNRTEIMRTKLFFNWKTIITWILKAVFLCTPNEWIFKKLVGSEKSLKGQRKWAQSQPPSSNRLKMAASWRWIVKMFKYKLKLIFQTASDYFFVAALLLLNQFLKKIVISGKSLKRQRKWAQSQPPSSNRLKMVASQRQAMKTKNWQY